MKHVGKVWWFGEHIDTDVIIPARYLTSNNEKELAQHCMETVDPDFAKNVEPGDFIVAGPLFGMGSSREHAPIAIKGCGVTAVIAPSFARIFQRNSINVGMPVLECDTLWEDVQQGDVIEVDMDEGTILHQRTEKIHKTSQYPEFLKEIIAAGGLVPYTRKKIEGEGVTAFNIAVLPGDGVGPEVMAEALKVLKAITTKYGHTFSIKDDLVGGAGIDEFGTPLRPQTVQMCRESDAVLMGAVGGPKWDDPTAATRPEDAILGLRKQLELFANLRPVKLFDALLSSSTFKEDVIRGVDLIFVREATGGTYFAEPKKVWTENGKRIGVDTTQYDEDEIARAVKLGFELARGRRKNLVSADKANVMASSRLWRTVATEVSKDYPDITFSHMYADACAMHLARRPKDFDVIVTDNLFGDVLSDEASMLAGSLGMMPSATLAVGGKFGLYEPIHGSAPDIAGKGIVNPLAMILTTALMLRISLGLETEAAAVESAVERALTGGARTPDIAQPGEATLSTSQMGDAVVANL